MKSEKYRLNLRRLAMLSLPTRWRKPIMGGLVYAMIRPLIGVYETFIKIIEDTDYSLSHNGQVCKLRALLNDTFDPEWRRIRISESWNVDSGVTAYERSASRWLMVGKRDSEPTIILNRRGYGGRHGYDFWVNVPASITKDEETRLRAIIDGNKLASKRYEISYFQEDEKLLTENE